MGRRNDHPPGALRSLRAALLWTGIPGRGVRRTDRGPRTGDEAQLARGSLPRRQRLWIGKPTFWQGSHSPGLQVAQRPNFRDRRARKLFRKLLYPIGTVERETATAAMDYPCGDHLWWNTGVRYGIGAELQMGNINESPFRGAFFGLIELVSRDFEKCTCVPHCGIGFAVSPLIVETPRRPALERQFR
jgi:hypothetical protein